MKSKVIIVLLISVSISLALPYIGVDNNFYMNYTKMCVECEPQIGFTYDKDSLDIDSLLLMYPSVSIMDSVSYNYFIEMKME